MSTLQLENIRHPDALGNALELSDDGSIGVGGNITGNVRLVGHNTFVREGHGSLSQHYQTADYSAITFKNSAGTNTYAQLGYDVQGTSGAMRVEGVGAQSSVALLTNGAVGLGVDSNRYVTMPNQPCFEASSTSGLTTYGAAVPIVMNTTNINVGNHYSTSTGYFTAPVSGFYSFNFSIYSYGTAQFVVLKNGAQYFGVGADSLIVSVDATRVNGLSWCMSLNQNDYVGFAFRPGYSGDVYSAHGHFSGFLVG